jgi:hypothetical protein
MKFRRLITRSTKRLLRRFGYELTPVATSSPEEYPPDFDLEEIEAYLSVADYTMAGPVRTVCLIRAVKYLVENEVPGDFVECGVWKGGSMMAVALTLLCLKRTDRRLWLFDTFLGMSKPTAEDLSITGCSPTQDLYDAEWIKISKDRVQEAMARTGYPMERVELIEGPVEDTIPTRSPEQIALLRLDTDWYESTRHELVHLYPRLSTGGVLLIDDYGAWQGARKATDEYIREQHLPLFLSRIDFSARIAVKST